MLKTLKEENTWPFNYLCNALSSDLSSKLDFSLTACKGAKSRMGGSRGEWGIACMQTSPRKYRRRCLPAGKWGVKRHNSTNWETTHYSKNGNLNEFVVWKADIYPGRTRTLHGLRQWESPNDSKCMHVKTCTFITPFGRFSDNVMVTVNL